jgi:DNA (cytosine-5)-methyltransferase 1
MQNSVAEIRFADLFCGIGGFRLGIEKASEKLRIPVKCVFSSEIEKNAVKIYEKNFKEIPSGDITKIQASDIPDIDILCGGFPCQDVSIAGKRAGLKGKRTGLFFDIIRILKEKKPSIVFLENVKGLLASNGGWDFATVLIELEDAGYSVEWCVLNSKDFGVPQNRERVFIIGHLAGRCRGKIFPIFGENKSTNGKNTNEVFAICDSGESRELQIRSDIFPPLRNGGGGCGQHNFICYPVLTPDRVNKNQNGRGVKNPNEPMFTLTAQDQHGVLLNYIGSVGNKRLEDGKDLSRNYPQGSRVYSSDGIAATLSSQAGGIGGKPGLYQIKKDKIRKLTPIECERLQAFPDRWTEGIADSNRYKCLGNSVTVNVIEAIAEKILKVMSNDLQKEI